MKKENEIQSLNEIAQYLDQCEAKYNILNDTTDEFTMHDITFTATTYNEGWIELKNRYLTIDNFIEYYNNSGFILTEKKYLHLKQNNSYYIIYININNTKIMLIWDIIGKRSFINHNTTTKATFKGRQSTESEYTNNNIVTEKISYYIKGKSCTSRLVKINNEWKLFNYDNFNKYLTNLTNEK